MEWDILSWMQTVNLHQHDAVESAWTKNSEERFQLFVKSEPRGLKAARAEKGGPTWCSTQSIPHFSWPGEQV